MNAAEQVDNLDFANALASAVTLVRQHFPEASANLNPWRDDPETRKWSEYESIDLAFHFPGWSPSLQCRCLLIQLRISQTRSNTLPQLQGVVMRGMTFAGERWRLATLGDWQPSGSHLPKDELTIRLQEICRDFFVLFPPQPSEEEIS